MTKTGIVAFAFGAPSDIRSNRRIAQMTMSQARKLGAPVYTQRDVCLDPETEVEYTEEKADRTPPTFRIARGAVAWARRFGLNELLITCAQPHLWRCQRDLEYAIREAEMLITVRACADIGQYPEGEWFPVNSTQPWVRSRAAWERRERILKLLPLFVYKLITG